MKNRKIYTSIIAASMLLVGCGGGGGGKKTPDANTTLTLDTKKPVISLNGAASVTITGINENYTDAGATANDDVDGDITANINVSGVVDVSKEGTTTLTYSVEDKAGNVADTITRTVIVVAKTLEKEVALTPANCEGHDLIKGKDLNGNGQLDGSEITTRKSIYTNGTPVTMRTLLHEVSTGGDVTKFNTC